MYRFSNLRSIRLILSNQVMKSVLDAILFIVIVSYMLVKSPLLSIYVFLFAGLLYLGIQLLRPHLHEASRNELSKDTKLFSYQNESVSGILNIKLLEQKRRYHSDGKHTMSILLKPLSLVNDCMVF